MFSSLRQRYQREQFNPSIWLGTLVNPFYYSRRGLYTSLCDLAPRITGRTLDVGCGRKPYQHLFPTTEHVGLEHDTPANRKTKVAEVFYDGSTFPFPDASFDSCLATEVLEHVFNPERFVNELHRVLKPRGTLLLTVPFLWGEHEQPYDYARYSSFGVRHLLESHGFVIEEYRKTCTDIRCLAQLLNAYIHATIIVRCGRLHFVPTLLLAAPVNLLGILLAKILPRTPDLYLDNIILAKKPGSRSPV